MSYRIKPHLPRIGKRYGKLIPKIKQALEAGDGASIAAAVARGDSIDLEIDGETVTLAPEDLLIETSSAEGYASAEDGGYLTALDTTLTAALIAEGMAREMIRSVQDARKLAGLEVSDRIVLGISGTAGIEAALALHRDYLMAETLATAWLVGQQAPLFDAERGLEEERWRIEISRSVKKQAIATK